ncbi:hypothetical protein HHA01_12350 [Halomonas halmophila]|uniref:Uncharacterized protein n=1 Tax=Halomonas halmophila TaxID=252 RepID=A0A4Y4F581_9GAMM|nr:hypothetical protein HHA01_12350 [Halomonas halmophila]
MQASISRGVRRGPRRDLCAGRQKLCSIIINLFVKWPKKGGKSRKSYHFVSVDMVVWPAPLVGDNDMLDSRRNMPGDAPGPRRAPREGIFMASFAGAGRDAG